MDWAPASVVRWLFASEQGASDRLISRWIFLRALGLIYFSAFLSLVFQIRGLIGPHGILPANDYLEAVGRSLATLPACGLHLRCFGFQAARMCCWGCAGWGCLHRSCLS